MASIPSQRSGRSARVGGVPETVAGHKQRPAALTGGGPLSEVTYKRAAAVLDEAKQIQAHLASQDVQIGKIVAALTPPQAG